MSDFQKLYEQSQKKLDLAKEVLALERKESRNFVAEMERKSEEHSQSIHNTWKEDTQKLVYEINEKHEKANETLIDEINEEHKKVIETLKEKHKKEIEKLKEESQEFKDLAETYSDGSSDGLQDAIETMEEGKEELDEFQEIANSHGFECADDLRSHIDEMEGRIEEMKESVRKFARNFN